MINLAESFRYPPYFISEHVKIEHPVYSYTDFNLYNCQEKLVNHINVNRYSICFSARQMGITNTLLAIALWHLNYRPNITIGICGKDKKATADMLDKFTHMYSALPATLRTSVRGSTKNSLRLSNGSSIMSFDPLSVHMIRGISIDLAIVDGFAHTQNSSSILNSLIPATSGRGGKIVLTSSTVPARGLFHDIWIDAINDDNFYAPLELQWDDHPDRGPQWKRQMISNMGRSAFEIEFENQFF